MDDFALTPAERALFDALQARGIKFLVIGLGAAVLEGAPVATQDIDLWFERLDGEVLTLAAKDAGGFWIPAFGMQPPAFGGEGLSRIDVVLTAHGLRRFADEYADSVTKTVDGVTVRVLPLERVIASKEATARPKDAASLPALRATLKAKQL